MKKSPLILTIIGFLLIGSAWAAIRVTGAGDESSFKSWMKTWFSDRSKNESDLHYATTNAMQYWADAIQTATKPNRVEAGALEIKPPDPEYNGRSLSSWLKHLYRYGYGGRQTNIESREAILQIGSNAVPLLINWIAKSQGSGWSSPDYAVEGFETLGPTAKAAVPDLIKIIGQNQNYPERALVFIGKDAVPLLADKLVETLSDTNNPIYDGGMRAMVHTTNGFYIRDRVLGVLNQLGTNAEPALPALIKTVTTNFPVDYSLGPWFQQNPYAVLANVGQNHPDIVIPILLERFTNSCLPPADTGRFAEYSAVHKRGQIVQAMAFFGMNQAKVFMPVLMAALSENKTNDWSRVQIGEALNVMGGNQPDVLVPVFLAALTDKNNNEGIRCSIAADLAKVAKNQPGIVIPALVMTYTNASLEGRSSIAGLLVGFGDKSRFMVPWLVRDSHSQEFPINRPDWKMALAVAAKKIAPENTNALSALIEDFDGCDGGTKQQRFRAFGGLGTNGLDAAPIMLKFLTNDTTQLRCDAIEALNAIGGKSDEYIYNLAQIVHDTNSFVAGYSQSALCSLATNSQLAFNIVLKNIINGSVGRDERNQAKYRLIDLSRNDAEFLLNALNDPDPKIRSGDLYVFYDLARGVPQAIPKLRELAEKDPDSDVRRWAADVLKLQLQ